VLQLELARALIVGRGEDAGQVRGNERIAEMMKMARELAGHGHRPQMIESVLVANGFREAPEFVDQPHIHRELRDIADRARRREETEPAIRETEQPRGH
jgi:succinyl-CoA synthetase beta subunit